MQKSKEVTLTKPFYMGVFMITQKQYWQVTDRNPTSIDHRGDMHPVEVSWNTIRGDSTVYDWPLVKTVYPYTFMGKIQAKTGLNFDLPTEAQWEYACRAGTSSDFCNGGGGDNDCRLVGHSYSLAFLDVGLSSPNFWGIYGMHGNNMAQWCRDHFGDCDSDPAIDYQGSDSSSTRVYRGGSYRDPRSTSFTRCGLEPASLKHMPSRNHENYTSFRLSLTLSE